MEKFIDVDPNFLKTIKINETPTYQHLRSVEGFENLFKTICWNLIKDSLHLSHKDKSIITSIIFMLKNN
jgi:hypothetical protein